MNAELNAALDYWEREKGIARQVLIEAIENAILSASKKAIGPAKDLRIEIDHKTGDIRAYAKLTVVEKVFNPQEEIHLAKAEQINPNVQPGDELEVEVTPKNFGRIAAQTARQAMMQRIRQAEKELIFDEFKDRAGEIVSGVVRRFDRSDVVLDLGKFEGIMPQRERVGTEEYNIGDRIRAYVVAVENGFRGPEIILSRSHPNFVRRLFESEVTEIADRTVEIRAIAREAGYRTKVAVFSSDERVDPVGACVGMRGSRVKNIVRELNNEKVDIIRWSDDIREFVIEALKPAKVKSIEIDDKAKAVFITVDEENLSLAIGRRGQNARLTSKLTGWDIKVSKDETSVEIFEAQMQDAIQQLERDSGFPRDLVETLVRGGVSSIYAFADIEVEDIRKILKIEEGEAERILKAGLAALAKKTGVYPADATEAALGPKTVETGEAPEGVEQDGDAAAGLDSSKSYHTHDTPEEAVTASDKQR